jgi:hypothetical protein
MGQIPREVPAADLRPGLTIWRISENGKHYNRDCYLADWQLTSSAPRMQVRKLQFMTGPTSYAVWHNAGTVLVTEGHDNRKTIPRKG